MADAERLLKEGDTVWRRVQANRAALLVDASEYYCVLHHCLRQAQHSIKIVGWDVNGQIELCGPGDIEDSHGVEWPTELGELLCAIADSKPHLSISVLQWDFALIYAFERELLPSLEAGWRGHPGIHIHLDNALPPTASHHQKIVVIDDALAFVGGIDLTNDRWDTREHAPDNPARCTSAGVTYPPWHDMQMMVDGPAARAISDVVCERWRRATGGTPAVCEDEPPADLWPASVEPAFREVELGVARTVAPYGRSKGVFEIEALALALIGAAERYIYIENQYFSADRLVSALIRRMREKPDLCVLVVGPNEPPGTAETLSMCAGRQRAWERLQDAGVADRMRLMFPTVLRDEGDERGERVDIMVHSKLMVVDDVLMRVGSANFNNRSLGLDTECDLVIAASSEEEARAIHNAAADLIGEHLACGPEEASKILSSNDILASFDERRQACGDRRLMPMDNFDEFDSPLAHALSVIADPTGPPTRLAGMAMRWRALFGEDDGPDGRRDPAGERWDANEMALSGMAAAIRSVGGAAIMLLLVALLSWTPAAEWLGLGRLAGAEPVQLAPGPVEYVIAVALIVTAGLVAFPIGPLVALAGFLYGWESGVVIAYAGAFLNAAVFFTAGCRVKSRVVKRFLSSRMRRIMRQASRRGIFGIAALRAVPVLPYAIINLAAGASGVKLRDFVLGTALVAVPGLAGLAFAGDRIWALWQVPSVPVAAQLAGAMALFTVYVWGITQVAARIQRRKSADSDGA